MSSSPRLRLLVVYASEDGHTRDMAEHVAEGARGHADTHVVLRQASRASGKDLARCDGLLAGTPVHMAGMDWRLKRFIDGCNPVWMDDHLEGKPVGAFATGGGYGNAGGGCDQALLGVLSAFAAMGMVPVPLPKSMPGYAHGGTPWGPWIRTETTAMRERAPSPAALKLAARHGLNVARMMHALAAAKPFARR
ncbi:NAD(P)H-dependent oxidoreductase [Oleiagrimonas sp. C23AA]|uniref:flavodoxin family protein n=1 Tax=Oleiagrimonas sp. C23AA TaxID=2719047 RepID=UPI001421D0CE|nr:NAD(P)H-dependent oxidoreductase [Oleiagrimonas sp. C23AA]NII10004.1 hypothetical protein [Oleiagrimonas sp. C23AA]